MESLLKDLRYAVRSLIRAPGFTISAVLTLALGIGANTAIFSIVDGVLLRPAPFAAADRLMMMWETDRNSGTTREPSSLPDFLDFQQRSKTFAQLAAFASTDLTLTPANGDPERVVALAVTAGFAPTLGIVPAAGRQLEEAETQPGGARSILVSQALAERLFGSPQDALGKGLRLNDVEWSIVGVMPRTADFGMRQVLGAAAYGRGFAERSDRARVDVWLGIRANVTSLPRTTHPIVAFGRLAPGATRAAAAAEMTTITADLERAYHENVGRGAFVEPLSDVVFGDVKPALVTLLGAVALVLLVACANVANLLLVRSAGRAREITVRVALGAGSRRLAQQFFVESIVLTSLGAIAGVAIAQFGLETLRTLAPAGLPRIDTVSIDGRVLTVTLLVSVAVSLVFGLLPTWRARGKQLRAALAGSAGRGASASKDHRRFRSTLVASELAMASMLMIGAGLLVRSLYRLERVDAGFAAVGVLKGEYTLPSSRYPQANPPVQQQQFDDALVAKLGALPGVEGVALASNHPLDAGFTSSIRVVGREAEAANWPEPSIRIVNETYFPTMRVPTVDGRTFSAGDNAAAGPVVVINAAAVKRYFPGGSAINQQINLWGANRTVVGIVGDEHFKGLANDAAPAVYLPMLQMPPRGGHSVLMRVRGEPSAFAAPMREAVRSLDARLPLYGVEPLPETLTKSMAQQRFTMLVLGVFAAVALLLASVGVHGVLSYTVAQRSGEIGIRMALGADAGTVRAQIVADGASILGAGLVAGLLGALALSRALGALLFHVSPYDPLTFAGVTLVLGTVALLATYLPARRASKVDPMSALRSE